MAKIPREFVREVVDRTSIVALVSQTVRLKRRGTAQLGLCPFHNEKTPSFHVNEDRKNFHCFGCGKSGDAIDWLQEVEGLQFLDAVKELADRAGMAVPQEELTPGQIQAAQRREGMLKANEAACQYFEMMLASPEGAGAREYLANRGYDMEFAKEWRVGFAPESWDGLRNYLKSKRISPMLGAEAGVLGRSTRGKEPYDFFRNRLMFPIMGNSKKVIAFGGRTLGDDKAK
ncbi:MAG: DNA primase, partial [Deltaproteobacteria bacterium]|nr:DNA primase [Deltaproteobacteria bacterium]